MKHTPGPWKGFIIGKPIVVKRWNIDGVEVCSIKATGHQCVKDFEERKANANLISAAPDLLKALEQAYGDILYFLNEGDFKRKIEWDAGYIVDVLKKAKGEI